MTMRYILLRLSPNNNIDPDFYCYQEVDPDGNLASYKDLVGNIIEPHVVAGGEYSGQVIDPESPYPSWGI